MWQLSQLLLVLCAADPQLVLASKGLYGADELRSDKGFVWILAIYNASYTVALYSLLFFYLGAKELLKVRAGEQLPEMRPRKRRGSRLSGKLHRSICFVILRKYCRLPQP